MPRRPRVLLLAFPVLALGLAACGGATPPSATGADGEGTRVAVTVTESGCTPKRQGRAAASSSR